MRVRGYIIPRGYTLIGSARRHRLDVIGPARPDRGDRRQVSSAGADRRSRNNQRRPGTAGAPQGFTWYGIPCSEQNAAKEPESAAKRKPGTAAADRTGLHTTDFLSCDNMTA